LLAKLYGEKRYWSILKKPFPHVLGAGWGRVKPEIELAQVLTEWERHVVAHAEQLAEADESFVRADVQLLHPTSQTTTSDNEQQGDQIGQIFTYLAIVSFSQWMENYRRCPIFGQK
jgi:hypothetical protein